jgi:hypothetical protein
VRRSFLKILWLAIQTALSVALGLVAPFVAYDRLARAGLDITPVMYGIIMAAYGFTFVLICAEGISALRAPPRPDRIDIARTISLRPCVGRRLAWEIDLLLHPPKDISGLERFSLRVWRPAYMWLSWQAIPLAAFWWWRHDPAQRREWIVPIAALLGVWVLHGTPAQTLFSYLLADRSEQRFGRFLGYLVGSMVFHAGLRHSVARVAQLRVIVGDRGQPAGRALESGADLADSRPAALAGVPAPDGEQRAPPLPESPPPAAAAASTEAEIPALAGAIPPNQGPEPTYVRAAEDRGLQGPPAAPAEVLAMAAELGELIDQLVGQRDSAALENARLADRVRELERILDARRSLTLQLHAATDGGVTIQDLRELYDTLDTLARHPSDIGALSAIGRQAPLLARVVTGYGVARGALKPN